MSGPRVRLVVTGDDFGYCPRRDRGMVEAFVAGALSEVSLLVNGAAASSAAQLARRHRIPAGLHANLSEGRPVSLSAGSGASLLGPSGCFLGKTGFREALAAGQVREELRAQLSRFRDLVGREPTHVDGHQHVHVLPGVRQVFAEVLREYGVRYTRVPVERGLHRCEWLEPQLQTFAVALEKDALAAREEFQELGLRCPDAFIGLSTMGKDMSVSRIEAAIDQAVESIQIPEDALKGGRAITLELMAHPGYPSVSPVGGCGEGPDDFSQSWERLHELQTLLDPTLHNFYRQRGIKLCAFEDL
ncbi:carbohydrate deacetylase isoform X6 [Monodelphis domestica]|uniref:carbohydrate deacetylase isoform X6 n=1 Tax=Monodelphis domestica TaxID=13616 RepID=UPI00044325F5|nr:carbohydrate deacetylase isoform X6 [Monodelphis domestica]